MNKAQGSLEYLLLIGGAILVAVIVIAIIISITKGGTQETNYAWADGICSKYSLQDCPWQEAKISGNTLPCTNENFIKCKAVRGIPLSACGTPAGGWMSGAQYYLEATPPPVAGPCFDITAPGVQLNCTNKKITATGGDGVKISSGADGVILRNCFIEASSRGIVIDGLSNTIYFNNVKAGSTAILITGTLNWLLNNSTCYNPGNGPGTTGITVSANPQILSSNNSCPIGTCIQIGGTTICNAGNCNVNC